MLYALRYEEAGNLRAVKARLLDSGISPEKVDLLDALLQYAGMQSWSSLWPFHSLKFFIMHVSNIPAHNACTMVINGLIYMHYTRMTLLMYCLHAGNASRGPGLYGQDNLMTKLGKTITTTLQVKIYG